MRLIWKYGTSEKSARDVEINVERSRAAADHAKAAPRSRQSFKEALDLSQFDGGGIRASVHSDGDALFVDDTAYAYVPVKRRTKTLLVTPGNRLIETALKLDRMIDLSVIDPKGYDANADFDAVVFDGYAPVDPPLRPALVLGFHSVPWLRRGRWNNREASPGICEGKSSGVAGCVATRREHRSGRRESIHRISRAGFRRRNTPSSWPRSGLAGFCSPSIFATRIFRITPASRCSSITLWPGFRGNGWRFGGRPESSTFRFPGRRFERSMAGAWRRTITKDGRNSRRTPPGCMWQRNPMSVNISQLTLRTSVIPTSTIPDLQETERRGPKHPSFDREFWFYMIFAALLLVGAEWWTYHRRITL